MADTDPIAASSVLVHGSDQEPREIRNNSLIALQEILQRIISQDSGVQDLRRLEGLTEEEVLEQATLIAQTNSDVESKWRDLESARAEQAAIGQPISLLYELSSMAGGLGVFGLFVLAGIGIAKATRHLLLWPIWPFVTFPLIFIVSGSMVASLTEPDGREAGRAAREVERLESELDDLLRSLIIIPAVENLSSVRLVSLASDVVSVTDAPGLSSRIDSSSRVQTGSYRDIVTAVLRAGGATIGLAGSRGAGKSELLSAFCDDPRERATVRSGGVVGVIVPTPVAYDAQSFLRVLVRRLAESVPDYADAAKRHKRAFSGRGFTVLLLAVVCAAFGITLDSGWTLRVRHDTGLILVLIAGLIALTWIFQAIFSTALAESLFDWLEFPSGFIIMSVTRAAAKLSYQLPVGFRIDADAARRLIDRIQRRKLSVVAFNVAQRIEYLEKRSVAAEHSLSWSSFGFKHQSGVNLDQVPLTEPDLVMELAKLVVALNEAKYQVRIGVDELDKLTDGQEAERFLNDVKVLFSIRDCSFILTISENAALQFAVRGMPIRDVFDSSLDAVITARPLTFYEARRLIRFRLLAGSSGRISDVQLLLCHCLSGGLPRDLLRSCRQLGELNARDGGNSALSKIMNSLLQLEIGARVDALMLARQSKAPGESGAFFLIELEQLNKIVDYGEIFRALDRFLSIDPTFADLCRPSAFVLSKVDVPSAASSGGDEDSRQWIREVRRQLYSFIYLVVTIRQALESVEKMNLSADSPDARSRKLEILADARRRLEMDAAAGWRCTTEARVLLGLEPNGESLSLPESLFGGP